MLHTKSAVRQTSAADLIMYAWKIMEFFSHIMLSHTSRNQESLAVISGQKQ